MYKTDLKKVFVFTLVFALLEVAATTGRLWEMMPVCSKNDQVNLWAIVTQGMPKGPGRGMYIFCSTPQNHQEKTLEV